MHRFVHRDEAAPATRYGGRVARPRSWAASARLIPLFIATAIGVFGAGYAQAAATYLLAYPGAPYDGASGTFTLTADGTTIPVTSFYGGRYSFGHLAFEGATTFVLSTRNGAAITGYEISPHDAGITGTVSGSKLTFSVKQGKSTYLIVKITTAAGTLQPMVIAGDPQETGAPTIGGNVVDITGSQYNADKTGNTLLNSTIQSAINLTSSNGGGTIYFPAGVYKISNNIQLKSNVTLYLAPGAFIRGSSNRNDYTWNDGADDSHTAAGDPLQGPQNFVIPGGVNNVAFKGRGTIDANSTVLVTPANVGGSVDGFGGYRKGIINSNKNNGGSGPNGITISGITIKDATTWTINLNDSNNVSIQNVKMVNDFNFVHSDGYDLVSTSNAVVDNCLGVTGDDVFDAKAASAGTMENVIYRDSVAYSYKGAGTKVGVQSTGNARNIIFSNIQVVAGYRAVSVSHDEGATGQWSDLHFNDIHMENLIGSSTGGQFRVAPIVIWSLGGGAGPVTNVSLSRVTIDNSRGFTSWIQGANAAGQISDVTLQDVEIDGTTITSGNVASKITVGSNVSGLKYGLVSGAVYGLASKHNGLALDNGNATTSNNPVIQWPLNYPATASQQWKLAAVGGNYTLASQKSGAALDNQSSAASGAGIVQSSLNSQVQQQWTITSLGDGWYKIINAQSGLALDDANISSGTQSTNTQVLQWTQNGNGTQLWKLTKQ